MSLPSGHFSRIILIWVCLNSISFSPKRRLGHCQCGVSILSQEWSIYAYIDHPVVIVPLQGVQHRCFIEASQHCHVFNHFKLLGIHLLDFVLLDTQTLQRGEKSKIYSPISSVLIHFCHALGRTFTELRKRCLIRGWSQRKLNQPVFSKKQVFLQLMFCPCPKIKFFKSVFVESKFSKLQCPDPVVPQTLIAPERTHIILHMI